MVIKVGEPELLGDPLCVTLLEVGLSKERQPLVGLMLVEGVVLGLWLFLEDRSALAKHWHVLSRWGPFASGTYDYRRQGGSLIV